MLLRLMVLWILLCTGVAQAMTCRFTWTNPLVDGDGNPLTNLAGTHVWRQDPAGAVLVATVAHPMAATVEPLPCKSGEEYVATAYNTEGENGPPSNVVVIRAAPGAPQDLSAEVFIPATIRMQVQPTEVPPPPAAKKEPAPKKATKP